MLNLDMLTFMSLNIKFEFLDFNKFWEALAVALTMKRDGLEFFFRYLFILQYIIVICLFINLFLLRLECRPFSFICLSNLLTT